METVISKDINFSKIHNIATTNYMKNIEEIIQYGTAGFRTIADNLNHVMFRMGLLATLRSKHKKAAVGLMITASHNPEPDNGIKIVDPAGEMLEASWEIIATKLANVEDSDVISYLQEIIKENNIDITHSAFIILGKDTRASSLKLSDATAVAIQAMGGQFQDFGYVTTPQLHYLVVCTNTKHRYGFPTLEGYYEKFSQAFRKIRGTRKNNNKYEGQISIDAANGVGAFAVKEFSKLLNDILEINIFNDGTGKLNHMCGADYVKLKQEPPININLIPLMRYASLDGDADRIVYFYMDEQKKFHLMDGDRIATLIASYLKELLIESGLLLNLGIVQTAYANGGSTRYILETLNIPVACVQTGVKHLHHKALEYDIGVYFEANGHGTIIFKESATELIKETANNKFLKTKEREAALNLSNVIDIINQTVGDAVSDMLLVETILHAKGWNIIDWKNSYQDLPNKQIKIKVKDRNIITTTDADRLCLTPVGLQDKINKSVLKYSKARAFVRPSGTEDVLRVYVECENEIDLAELATEVCKYVSEMAGGI